MSAESQGGEEGALRDTSVDSPGLAGQSHSPTEHAIAESFFKTVKWEEVYLHQYQTFEEAQAHLQTFLEDVYNAKNLHSSLDYVPPDEFELKYAMCSRLSGLDFLGALQWRHSTSCCHLGEMSS